jgi:endo-1,4-beta-xylanase
MMRVFISCIIVLFIISACAPIAATATEIPTTPPITIQATATKNFTATVIGRANLFNFPDQTQCTAENILPAGAEVTVTGTYKDYAAVEFEKEGVLEKGYIPKVNLSGLTPDLPELTTEQLPWRPVVDYSALSYYSPENGGELTVSSASTTETDIEIGNYTLTIPLRIQFGLQVSGAPWGEVKILGKRDNQNPWWKDTIRMNVGTNGSNYELCIRDGTTEDCTVKIEIDIPQDQQITLLFLDKNGDHLQVLDQTGKMIKEIDFTNYPGLHLPNGFFPDGVFYFGTTVGFPGTLKVTNLSITTPPTGVYATSWITEPGLAELAAPKGILIGTEFNPGNMSDDRFCRIIRHDFNMGALSVFSDASIWTAPDEYNFQLLDQQVNAAADYGLTLYASHLVYGAVQPGYLPDWLTHGNFSKEDLLNILHNHITTLVTRYKDKVKIWSIANEAPERDRYPGNDFWYDHIGPEYIEKSFEWAREADPDAILIFNADNNESPRDANTTYNINTLYQKVKTMKENGVPIDAIGMQMHLFVKWNSKVMPKEADVEATMKKFGGLGVKVMITEMDVDMHEIPGTPQQKAAAEVQLYTDMMTACINSGVCTAFETWGVSDSMSLLTAGNAFSFYKTPTPDAAPLLFDVNFEPKPAYFAVLDVLKGTK